MMTSAAESDGEGHFEQLIAAQNRKHKKSGGWQAIGISFTNSFSNLFIDEPFL